MDRSSRAHLLLLVCVAALLLVGAAWSGDRQTSSPAPSLQVTTNSTSTPIPLADEPYTNPLLGFSLRPPAGWRVSETGQRDPLVSIRDLDGPDFVAIQVSVFRLDRPTPIQDWLMGEVALYGGGSIDILEDSPAELGPGTYGHKTLFDWSRATGVAIKEQWTGVVRKRQGFAIRAFGVAADLDRIMGTIDAVMSSFTLEPPDLSAASREDVLTLWGGDIETLDPALYTGSPAGIPGAIFSGLVSLDENMSVVPDIARTWSRSKDGTVYTFILQPDVVFHDGRRVTARDFKYAWERAADPATGSPTARTYLGDIVGVKEKLNGEATEVAGIRVLSELVLQVTIDAPKHHFLYKLAYPTAYVVDWANVKSGADWTDRPNGTGAFRLAEWRKGELMLLERNDHYHHEPATLSQVVFRLSGGPQVAMYERDEIDIARVTAADIDRMLDQAAQLNKHVLSGRRSCTHYLGFNVTIPPFDDPSVRQAFALALDVDKKLSLGLGVTARRASGVLPPGIPGHVDLVEPVPFDPARARALVAESRYGIAEGLPRIVSYAEDDALHWMWREHLGVEVEARSLPDRRDRRARLRAEGLPLWSGGWCADYPDAQNFLELLFGSDSDNNHFGYSNADVDERLARAAAEESPAARAATYREVERLVLDDWVAVPLWHSREYVLARPYIAGYGVTPIRVPFLHRIYFER